jgi:hypothetical protein
MMRSTKSSKEALELWKQARAHLEAAAKLGGHNRGRIQRLLAEACIALSDLDAAQAAFTQSILAAPDAANLQSFLSFSLKANRVSAYIDAINTAIAQRINREPRNPAALSSLYLALANAYQQMGGQREAEGDALCDALTQTPDRYAIWERYARFYNFDLTRLKKVGDDIRRKGGAAGEIPKPIDTLLQAAPSDLAKLADAVTLAGQTCLTASKRSRPEILKQDFGWLANLLRTQIESSQGPVAEKGKALRALGALYAALGEGQSADQVLTTAQGALTGSDRVYCTLEHADLLAQLGRHQDALATAELARKDAPNDPLVLLCVARRYAALRRIEEARAIYETLRRNPALDSKVREQVELDLATLH